VLRDESRELVHQTLDSFLGERSIDDEQSLIRVELFHFYTSLWTLKTADIQIYRRQRDEQTCSFSQIVYHSISFVSIPFSIFSGKKAAKKYPRPAAANRGQNGVDC
jgi:hypothetical protein